MKTLRFDIRLTPEERRLLEEAATRERVTMSALLVRALRLYVGHPLRRDPGKVVEI